MDNEKNKERIRPLVLLDFYADWCGSCQTMAPIVDEIESLFGDKLEVLKIDTDQNSKIVARFKISSIPAYILMKEAKVIWRRSGLLTKAELQSLIESYL